MISLVPAYTLEKLDTADIERILPYYFYDYRRALKAKQSATNAEEEENKSGEFVIRDGKKYKVTTVRDASWAKSIF